MYYNWAALLKIPPDAVCHRSGARVASQRCLILPNDNQDYIDETEKTKEKKYLTKDALSEMTDFLT